MDGISFGMSEGAIMALSGVAGALLRGLFSGSSRKRAVTEDACEKEHKRNDEQHKEFYQRIEILEIAKAENGQTLKDIDRRLTSIDDKLDR